MASKKYVLDSYPMLVFFKKQSGWETVRDLLFEGHTSEESLLLSVINWGEIYYSILKDQDAIKADEVISAIRNLPIKIIDVNIELAKQAAIYKAKGGIAYADCFAAALAKKEKAVLVTGDLEFRTLEKSGEIKIMWI